MFEVTAYIFYVCLFPTNGELSYTIYRTGIDSSNMKLKIGGSIDLPFYDSKEQRFREIKDDGHPVIHVLRMSKEKGIDGSPPNPVSVNTTEISDYSDYGTESPHNNRDKPVPDSEVNGNTTGVKETPRAPEQKIRPNSAFVPVDPALRIPTTTIATKRPKPHKVQDDDRIRNFSSHVYKQALKAFDSMKAKADQYTQKKIDSLAETYKAKFKEFVKRTRDTPIKTSQGAQNAILHTIDTSNLIMKRIVNYLKTDMLGAGTNALRQSGASRLQKELDTLKVTEFEHACKMFGICRSAGGFRNELQNIISTLLALPDDKLLQVNDAATEILKNADLSAFTLSNPIQSRMQKAIRAQEITDAAALRSNLEILFGVLSKSHQPLIVDKGKPFEQPAVERTVSFHTFLDAIDDALPPTEANKKEWLSINNRLKNWKNGGLLDVQDTLQALFNNVNGGVARYGGIESIREAVRDIARSVVD